MVLFVAVTLGCVCIYNRWHHKEHNHQSSRNKQFKLRSVVLQCNSDYITCCIRHSNYEQCIHTIRVVAFELDCSCTVLLQGVVLECSNSVQHSTLKVNCSGTCKTLDLMIDSGRRAWVRQISTHCVIVCVPILCCRPHLLDSRVSGLCALCCHSPLCYETSPRLLYSNDVC
jgi:hypothetical protein